MKKAGTRTPRKKKTLRKHAVDEPTLGVLIQAVLGLQAQVRALPDRLVEELRPPSYEKEFRGAVSAVLTLLDGRSPKVQTDTMKSFITMDSILRYGLMEDERFMSMFVKIRLSWEKKHGRPP